jgi:hypothetical protein
MSGPRAPHWLRHKPQRTPLKFEGPPNWDSDLVRAVQRDYPDDSDPFVYLAWLAAAYLAGATHPKDSVPLSKELRRALAYLDARRKPRGHSDGLDELRLRQEHRRSLR